MWNNCTEIIPSNSVTFYTLKIIYHSLGIICIISNIVLALCYCRNKALWRKPHFTLWLCVSDSLYGISCFMYGFVFSRCLTGSQWTRMLFFGYWSVLFGPEMTFLMAAQHLIAMKRPLRHRVMMDSTVVKFCPIFLFLLTVTPSIIFVLHPSPSYQIMYTDILSGTHRPDTVVFDLANLHVFVLGIAILIANVCLAVVLRNRAKNNRGEFAATSNKNYKIAESMVIICTIYSSTYLLHLVGYGAALTMQLTVWKTIHDRVLLCSCCSY